ncbi:MAG: hypothetical protein HW405_393 [Candidatus Berkelbacteria bacterium]|nr:hypothetical protein [Candidatus Berkelbacteria bacterium]
MKRIIWAEITICLFALMIVAFISWWAFKTDKFLPKAAEKIESQSH